MGTESAFRYVNEDLDTLAAPAPSRVAEANPDPLRQAEHPEHGMNVRVLATTALARLRALAERPFARRRRPGFRGPLMAMPRSLRRPWPWRRRNLTPPVVLSWQMNNSSEITH
ncbi:two-component response regulator [Streptomyces sp. NBRC 110611]|nr:two-component response regulator [Streptomyces sp. NBRC 110611]